MLQHNLKLKNEQIAVMTLSIPASVFILLMIATPAGSCTVGNCRVFILGYARASRASSQF